jgi:hypothetical protein
MGEDVGMCPVRVCVSSDERMGSAGHYDWAACQKEHITHQEPSHLVLPLQEPLGVSLLCSLFLCS